jgi:hypothetical protein
VATLAELLRGEVEWFTEAWGVSQGSYLLAQSVDVPVRWYDENGQRLRYPDWTEETTRVVSGPYGYSKFPGRWFPDRRKARRYWQLRVGHIYQEAIVPGRWVFRIPRSTSAAVEFRSHRPNEQQSEGAG